MYERLFNLFVICTLSALAFTLVAFGFEWIYQLWLANAFASWIVSVVVIPMVALICAVLIYLFFYALDDEQEETYPPYK